MAVDTRFRAMSVETLNALKLSTLQQLKNVEGVGESHNANGRQTSLPKYTDLIDKLADIESAIAWKAANPNAGNAGFVSRYASFNPAG